MGKYRHLQSFVCKDIGYSCEVEKLRLAIFMFKKHNNKRVSQKCPLSHALDLNLKIINYLSRPLNL